MNKQDFKKTKNAKCVGKKTDWDIFCNPWDAGLMIMCDHYPGYCKPATPVPTPHTCTDTHGCENLTNNKTSQCYIVLGDSWLCGCKPGLNCFDIDGKACGKEIDGISFIPGMNDDTIKKFTGSYSCRSK
jgi:hypothetical protein